MQSKIEEWIRSTEQKACLQKLFQQKAIKLALLQTLYLKIIVGHKILRMSLKSCQLLLKLKKVCTTIFIVGEKNVLPLNRVNRTAKLLQYKMRKSMKSRWQHSN